MFQSFPDFNTEETVLSERQAPILALNGPVGPCASECEYGGCGAYRTVMACGGCCFCLGGCQVGEESRLTAPHVWEGDYA